ncbi:MAG: PA2778 family cysteine peptidase [Gammaproteobacteria bacterium]
MYRIHIRPTGLIVVLVWLLAGGCANRSPFLEVYLNDTNIQSTLELRGTPFFPQREYQCGPSALATVLAASGISVSPDELKGKTYLPNRQGSLQLELIAASRRYSRLPYVLDGKLSAILSELASARPVLVLQNLGRASYPIWHYAVVTGFDASRNEIILRSGDRERLTMSTRKFMRSWDLAEYWALVVLRPGEMPATPDESRYVSAIAALESAGQADAAARFYTAALSRWPDNTLALFGTGNIQYAQGDRGAAEKTFRRLLVLQPEHAAARNNYAHILAESGCRAVALAEIDAGLANVDDHNPVRQYLLDTHTEILDSPIEAGATERSCPALMSTPHASKAAPRQVEVNAQ